MTDRDEQRAACISAMAACFGRNTHLSNTMELMTRVFDAQHGIAGVTPVEVTNDMIRAGERAEMWQYHPVSHIFRAMIAAGDLTNGPELEP